MCLYRNDVSPIWKSCSKSYKKNNKNRMKRKILCHSNRSRNRNSNSLKELTLFNELVVVLLDQNNSLIINILPFLIIYDLLLIINTIIEIYHVILLNIIVELHIGSQHTLLELFSKNNYQLLLNINLLIQQQYLIDKDSEICKDINDKASVACRVINHIKEEFINAITIAPAIFNSSELNYEFSCFIIYYSRTVIEENRIVSKRRNNDIFIRENGGGIRNIVKPDRFCNSQELKEKTSKKDAKSKGRYSNRKSKKSNKNTGKNSRNAGRKKKIKPSQEESNDDMEEIKSPLELNVMDEDKPSKIMKRKYNDHQSSKENKTIESNDNMEEIKSQLEFNVMDKDKPSKIIKRKYNDHQSLKENKKNELKMKRKYYNKEYDDDYHYSGNDNDSDSDGESYDPELEYLEELLFEDDDNFIHENDEKNGYYNKNMDKSLFEDDEIFGSEIDEVNEYNNNNFLSTISTLGNYNTPSNDTSLTKYPENHKEWTFADSMNYIKEFGKIPPVAFEHLKNSKPAYNRFKAVLKSSRYSLFHCHSCKECRFFVESKVVKPPEAIHICDRCFKDRTEENSLKERFSFKNGNDPLYCKMELLNENDEVQPNIESIRELQALKKKFGTLSMVENRFISKSITYLNVIHLRKGGLQFKGNCISFDIKKRVDVTQLPRNSNDLGIVVVRRRSSALDDTYYKTFKVRKNAIYEWLTFLKKYNPVYADIEVKDIDLWKEELDQVGNDSDEIMVYNGIPNFVAEKHDDDDTINNKILQSQEQSISAASSAEEEESDFWNEGPCENRRKFTDPMELDAEDTNIDYNNQGKLDYSVILPNSANAFEGKNILEEDKLYNHLHLKKSSDDGKSSSALDIPDAGTSEPMSEYEKNYLFTKCYPTDFPFGAADYAGNETKVYDTTLLEWSQHIQYYAVTDKGNNFFYPFVNNPVLMFHIINMQIRNRIMSQASVYIKNHDDSNMLDYIIDNPDVVAKRMARYLANIPGSPAYFVNGRNDLKNTINQKGFPHLWFTVSVADYHLPELWRLLPQPPSHLKSPENKIEFIKWKTNILLQNVHIVNDFMMNRTADFFKEVFGSITDAKWYWYRVEWQKRGTGGLHVHGVVNLKNAPDLTQLAFFVYKGRKAFIHRNVLLNCYDKDMDGYSIDFEEERNDYGHKDIFNETFDKIEADEIATIEKMNYTTITDAIKERCEKLSTEIERGIEAEKRIIAFNDYIITCKNHLSQLPVDFNQDERSDSTLEHPTCHPCSNDESEYSALSAHTMCGTVNRHHHTPSYCQKKGSCRFQYPKPIVPKTILQIEEVMYKDKSSIRRLKYYIHMERNDKWMSPHNLFLSSMWNGNMDLQILTNPYEIINYISKYASKPEETDKGFKDVLLKNFKEAKENMTSAHTAVRSAAIQACTSHQSTLAMQCHLNSSNSLIISSFSTVNIRLQGMSRKADGSAQCDDIDNLEKEGVTIKGKTIMNINDGYSNRSNINLWNLFYPTDDPQRDFKFDRFYNSTIKDMSFLTFASKYRVKQSGKDKGLIDFHMKEEERIVVFSPRYDSRPKNKSYHLYCYYSLVTHCPWTDQPSNIILNAIKKFASNKEENLFQKQFPELYQLYTSNTLESIFTDNNGYFKEQKLLKWLESVNGKELIEYIWNSFKVKLDKYSLNVIENERIYDSMGSQIEDDQLYDNFQSQGSADSNNEQNQFLLDQYNGLNSKNDANIPKDYEEIPWDIDHDWYNHTFNIRRSDEDLNEDRISGIYSDIKQGKYVPKQRRIVKKADLQYEQPRAVSTIIDKINEHDQITSTSSSKIMILCGGPGNGKSYTLDCIHYELSIQSQPKKMLQLAPTGVASIVCGGVTYQSNQGLYTYLKGSFKDGELKNELQQRFKGVDGICIDEFSFVSLQELHYINLSCQAAKGNDLIFGGMFVLLCGDIEQMPPVGADPLWKSKIKHNKSHSIKVLAQKIYRMAKTVVLLETSCRLKDGQQEFAELLPHFSLGNMTRKQHEKFQDDIVLSKKTLEEQNEFKNPVNTVGIFATNDEVRQYNMKALLYDNLKYHYIDENDNNNLVYNDNYRPIVKISSIYTGSKRKIKDDSRVPHICFMKVGSPVMITSNIAVSCGLGNGTMGTVIDFIFPSDYKVIPQTQPKYVIVNVPDYIGPPFFKNIGDGVDRSLWVPLLPRSSALDTMDFNQKQNSRTNFPIRLGHSFTGHKCQGLTIKSKIMIDFGEKEYTSGWSYVTISRVQDKSQLCSINGGSYERFTSKVQGLASFKDLISERNRIHELAYDIREKYYTEHPSEIKPLMKKPILLSDIVVSRKQTSMPNKKQKKSNIHAPTYVPHPLSPSSPSPTEIEEKFKHFKWKYNLCYFHAILVIYQQVYNTYYENSEIGREYFENLHPEILNLFNGLNNGTVTDYNSHILDKILFPKDTDGRTRGSDGRGIKSLDRWIELISDDGVIDSLRKAPPNKFIRGGMCSIGATLDFLLDSRQKCTNINRDMNRKCSYIQNNHYWNGNEFISKKYTYPYIDMTFLSGGSTHFRYTSIDDELIRRNQYCDSKH